MTSLNEPSDIVVDITEQIICEFLFLHTRHLGHIYDYEVLNPGAKQTIKALWCMSLPVVIVVPGSFRYLAAGCALATVIIFTHGRTYHKKVKPVVTNPLDMIRYPGVFPYPVKGTMVPAFKSGPMSSSVMYSLRLSTPFRLDGRIRYYGPITVLRSSCRSTRGHFTCQFIIIHSTNIRRGYNCAKPKKVQRLITWYDPIPIDKQSQSINTTSTLATHGQGRSLTMSHPVRAQNAASCNLSISPVITLLSISDSADNDLPDVQVDHATSSVIEATPATMVDQSEVNVLLARIAELEGIVVQQKIQIGEKEATAIDDHGQETFDEKVWANRSTAPIQEPDASAWAEAALISQANTIADSNRAALKQSITIGRLVKQQAVPTERLREMVKDRDQTIKKQEETISDLQARQRRGAFKFAGTASKDSKTVKQLEKELQIEKDDRATDAQKAQNEMVRAKADAAKALAAHQKQCEVERVAANDEHQREISNRAASQSQSETKVQALEEQVSALKQENDTKGEKIKRLTSKLETTTNKLHGATSLMQKAEKGLEAQKQACESEKQEMRTKSDTSTKRLTAAEAQVKSLQKQVEELVEMDEIHEATKSEYQDEIDEKDGAIKALRAEIEDSKAKAKSEVDIITRKDKEITMLKAKIEKLKAMWKKLQGQWSSSTTSAYHAKQDAQKKEEMIRKLEAKRLILVAIIDTERKGRDQCAARITTQQAKQSEVVQSLQRDVSSRDDRVKDLEKKVEDLRRQLVNTDQPPLGLPAVANHVLQQAANAVVALPTTSPAPTLPPSEDAATTPIVPLSAESLIGNEATASAIPLPPSSATSQASAPSSSPQLDLSATDPQLPPRSGMEDSWSDIGLPSEHSFSEDSEPEADVAPVPAEEPSEPEVITCSEVEEPGEEPTNSLPPLFAVEDGLEVEDITEHVGFLTPGVGEGQRLITWPYGMPQLSICWVQGTEIEALSSRTGSLTSNTDKDEPTADSPSASHDAPSEQETKGHKQTPSGADHNQTEKDGRKDGDPAQKESVQAVNTAATLPNIVQMGTVTTIASGQANDSTQARPAEQLTPTITVTPSQASTPLSRASNQSAPIQTELSSESKPSTASNKIAGSKGKAKEVITPALTDGASRPTPQQLSAVDGTLPNLVQDSSTEKTEEAVNDKGIQVKAQAVSFPTLMPTCFQLRIQQPRGTSDDESKDETSKDTTGITGIPSDDVEGTLPDADPSTQAYDRPQTEGNRQAQQAVPRVPTINVVPIMAGGTHPSMVQTNSSNGKQREEVAEDGDEPMEDEVSPPLTPPPPRSQKLRMI